MRKGSGTKTRISITLDKDIVDKLNIECEKRIMKISPYIESIIKKELKK